MWVLQLCPPGAPPWLWCLDLAGSLNAPTGMAHPLPAAEPGNQATDFSRSLGAQSGQAPRPSCRARAGRHSLPAAKILLAPPRIPVPQFLGILYMMLAGEGRLPA